MGMGTGKRLAVLLMGPEREGSPCGEEVTPRGAIPALAATLSRDRGWSLFWCLSHGPESPSPSVCVSLCELEQPPHPEGSSEPLGGWDLILFHLNVSSCRSCTSLDPLTTNSTSTKHFSVLTHKHALSPSELKGSPTARSPWCVRELLWSWWAWTCRTARVQMNRDTGLVPFSSGNSTCRFPWQVLSPLKCRSGSRTKVLEWLYPEYRQDSVEGKKKGVCTSEAA